MRSPLPAYYGGKSTLAPIIAQYVPYQFGLYLEPFFGSGGLFFHKPRWALSEVINDLNGEVVNFFRVLRDRPDKLIKALQLTPHARQEVRESKHLAKGNEITRALYFFVRVNQAYSGSMRANGGWTLPMYKKNRAGDWMEKTNPTRLYQIANRLRLASIENAPALRVMKQYDSPHTFIYADPPYLSVNSPRDKLTAYAGFDMQEDEHKEFVEACLRLKSMIIISGYDHPLYDPLVVQGWRRVVIPVNTKAMNSKLKKDRPELAKRNEILWISPNITFVQNPLF